jgi:large subunit ribosomal protein L25
METITLSVKKRETETRKEPENGLIPAVLYGKGFENQTLWVDSKQFDKIYKEAGESSIIDLAISDKKSKKTEKVLIYELQSDPVTDEIVHVDFYRVKMDEVIETDVGLKFVGEAPAVKELGGVLVRNLDEVEVKCLPLDLPKEIEVDISVLKTFEDYIYIKDLNVSDKVEINVDAETVVALVSPPRSQEEIDELETEVEADVSQVEGMEEEQEEETGEEEEPKKEEPKPEDLNEQ